MTEAVEVRSSTTTTMVIDSRNGDTRSAPVRTSKKTFTDDLYSTFSSPLAWILVLALIITWSCVFIIMFDLMDSKTMSGGLSRISSDPMKLVNDAMEESANMFSGIFKFAANLIAPDEDDGNLYAVRKKALGWLEEEEEEEVVVTIKKAKGEFLPSRSKGVSLFMNRKCLYSCVHGTDYQQ
ncbi:hypothetical protein LDENG_00125860 [Lucifuga dentata]|nr:hypothetical protein LDENG_00125860 [Lucifuga dentata]